MIAEMAGITENSFLQIVWITTTLQHFMVVVGLHDGNIGFSDVVSKRIVYETQVGGHQDAMLPVTDEKACIVGTVVRNRERKDFEFTDFEFHIVFQVFSAGNQLLCHAVTMIHPVVRLGCCIDRNVVLLAKRSDGFDMVVVVVCDKNAENLAEIYAYLPELFAKGPGANAGIYENALHDVAEVVAIAAASAAKAQKS